MCALRREFVLMGLLILVAGVILFIADRPAPLAVTAGPLLLGLVR